ncbi:MAG: Hsp33 family molecular chaperone HslO [Pseudomonadota bacterium]
MTGERALDIPGDDLVLPFQIDPFGLRGRLVRLGPALDAILRRHAYPAPVGGTLAEMVAMASALAATLKFDGVFTLQIKGDGPIRLMIADLTSAGDVRGYAQYDGARIAALPAGHASVPKLFGTGHLAFTVDQGTHTERYQGIVELQGTTLAECAHHYFRQSVQLQAGIKVAAAELEAPHGVRAWRAGALMVQRSPPAGGPGAGHEAAADDVEEGWRRAMVLMGGATAAELVDPDLPAWRLIDRLFLTEGVHIYRPVDLRHACRCSRERVATMLRALSQGEIEALKIDGTLVVTCEFCNRRHVFDDAELAGVYGS